MKVRLVVAALLAVLTLVSSAWAECAWVLWRHFSTVEAIKITLGEKAPIGAFTSYTECDEAARTQADAQSTITGFLGANRADAKKLAWGAWRSTVVEADGKGQLTDYQCFPDTVDPRAPKGK